MGESRCFGWVRGGGEGGSITTQRGRRKGNSQGEEDQRGGLKYLGDVTYQDSRASLGQRTLKGSRDLGHYSYIRSFQQVIAIMERFHRAHK